MAKKSKELTCISMVQIDTGEYVPLKSLGLGEQKRHMRRINLLAADAIARTQGLTAVIVDENIPIYQNNNREAAKPTI